MSVLKMASNRVHLGLGGSNSNLEEDEGLRRRTSVMEDGSEFDLVGP